MIEHFGQPRRAPLTFLFIAVFIDLVGYGMVLPLLPFFVQQQGGSAALVGILGSLYAGLQFICGPVLGSLSDRYGRRPVLLLCLLGTALGYTLLGLANSLAILVLAVVLDGATGANLATAQAYIADRTEPEARARGMGIVGAAFGLGLICGPALGGLLSLHSLQTPALVAAVIALGNVLFGFFTLPESLPPTRRSRMSLSVLNPGYQLSQIIRIPHLRGLLLTVFLLNVAFAGLQSNFALFSNARFGWNAAENTWLFAFVGVCAVATQGVLLGWLQRRFNDAWLVLAGLGLMAVNLALIALVTQPWMLYPVIGLVALGSGISIPALTSLVSQRADSQQQGQLMGGLQALLALTAVIGPALAGLSFEYVGVVAPYWMGSGWVGIALLCAVVTLAPYHASSGATSNANTTIRSNSTAQ